MARFTSPDANGAPGPTGPVGPKGEDATLPQGLTTEDSPYFDKIYVTNNGEGTNVKIGDDAWIGDVNEANFISIIGVEDPDRGGILLGQNSTERISTTGTNIWIESDNDIVLNPGSTYAYLGEVIEENRLATLGDITFSASSTSVLKHDIKAGEALSKGQAVYVSSADGTNMIVSKASNSGELTSSKTIGLVTSTLALNGQGEVITEGLLAGLNTSTATAGDPVWLGTNGNLIYGLANKPVAPAHLVFIGIVTRVNSNNGEIFVKVQNGFELEELHNVLIGSGYSSTPADHDLLAYDSASGLWTNQTAEHIGFATVAMSGSYNDLTNIPSSSTLGSATTTTYTNPYKTWTVPTANVNNTLNIVTLASHGLSNGDAVVYYTGGGSPIAPLTGGSTYYIRVYDSNAVYLYDTAAHAIATSSTTGLKDLGATGTNAQYFTTQGAGATTTVVFDATAYDTFVVTTSTAGGIIANITANLNNGESKDVKIIIPGGASNYTFAANLVNSGSVTGFTGTITANINNIFRLTLVKMSDTYSIY